MPDPAAARDIAVMNPITAWGIRDRDIALLVDLYELTMGQSYFDHGVRNQATLAAMEPANRIGK